ncbi:hypothetical protein [Rickettsia helvetica]|uniref:Uncharacterized protein n=1 Tax=Rickettsia helvetica TaxID=35789 RepID=A0ABM9NB31_RICHE|nr:hypothetical protein [Rickettsia helvetica]MCZ6896732.1 hypothetical protein [Rickettsia endosymbiont of Ixodes ricinus]
MKHNNQGCTILKNNELVNNFFITFLDTRPQTINDDIAKLIATKIKNINTITSINFSGSQISYKEIKIIIEALKSNKKLEAIDFLVVII